MNSKFQYLAQRAFNTPMLLSPDRAAVLYSYLSSRINATNLVLTDGEVLNAEQCKSMADNYDARASGTYRVEGGVAIIPVEGSLVHKSGYIGASSGVTGYDGIAAQLNDAANNTEVLGVLLDVNSGGGEVPGCAALADKISNFSKPIWAISNELASSAAYWTASSANKLFVTETAEVGSVGVIMAHADFSRQLESEGVKVTLIYGGKHKADGNMYEVLAKDVQDKFKAEIDSLRLMFAGAIAKNRNISLQSVLDTEAQCYRGIEAVNIGFADSVASFDSVLSQFKSFLTNNFLTKSPTGRTKGASMSIEQSPAGADLIQAQKDGATSERLRIASILNADAAKGRETQAKHLALKTDMTAEQATDFLATFPVVEEQKQTMQTINHSALLEQMSIGANAPVALSEKFESNNEKQSAVFLAMMKGNK